MKLFAKTVQLFLRTFRGYSKVSFGKPGVTSFYFTGSSNSWISRGQTRLLESPEYTFAARSAASARVDWSVRGAFNSGSYDVTFISPLGQDLAVGEYTAATRFPFQEFAHPGLCFSGDGRGNNRLIGNFKILEFVADRKGVVQAFAADFYQFDEERKEAWNFGSIRFNSSVPLTREEQTDMKDEWAAARFGGRLSPQNA